MANYKIQEIEGIGPVFGEKLAAAGITTVNDLLEKGKTRQGRKRLAQETGIDESLILKWVNMADLFRVPGIASEYAQLLEKCGVDTVKELRNRNPENLYEKMKEVNAQGQAQVRQLPSLGMVQKWVEAAKTMEPAVEY